MAEMVGNLSFETLPIFAKMVNRRLVKACECPEVFVFS